MSKEYLNISVFVKKNGICSGCGACAGVCPQKTLEMKFNRYGEYIPVDLHGKCSANCRLCLQICPFSSRADNEDTLSQRLFSAVPNIQHRPETGYYLTSYVGYTGIGDHRLNGASGGLATWTIETLLKQGRIDYAVCVTPNPDQHKLFKYIVCKTPEQIRASAKSCYYPVEMSEIIQHILCCDGRYAIVGLPCFIKALRLVMQKSTILRKRIKYLLGLVCGQQKSTFFSEYISALGGGDPRKLVSVHFREKDEHRPASDYGLRFACETDRGQIKEGTVFWTEGMDHVWCSRYFTLNACNFCDDIFAELADVAFMDAWLPEFKGDWRGTSIVLIRNPNIRELIKNGLNVTELVLESLGIDHVIQSQAGGVFNKRTLLGKRLTWAARNKRPVIPKRVQPMHLGLSDTLSLNLEDIAMRQSKAHFLNLRDLRDFCSEEFSQKMQRAAWYYKLIYKIIRKLNRIKQRIARFKQ